MHAGSYDAAMPMDDPVPGVLTYSFGFQRLFSSSPFRAVDIAAIDIQVALSFVTEEEWDQAVQELVDIVNNAPNWACVSASKNLATTASITPTPAE